MEQNSTISFPGAEALVDCAALPAGDVHVPCQCQLFLAKSSGFRGFEPLAEAHVTEAALDDRGSFFVIQVVKLRNVQLRLD